MTSEEIQKEYSVIKDIVNQTFRNQGVGVIEGVHRMAEAYNNRLNVRSGITLDDVETAVQNVFSRNSKIKFGESCDSKSDKGVPCGLPSGHDGRHQNGTRGVWD